MGPKRDKSVLIMGAPYVFARAKLRKPFHVEVVTLLMRGALCHNGCGLYYLAATDAEMRPDDVCPTCNAPPKPWSIGSEPEQVEVTVKLAFGNVRSIDFLRSLGPVKQEHSVQKRAIHLPVSMARVKKPAM